MLEQVDSNEASLEGEDQEAFNQIVSELEARPHLAFPLAQWMIPNFTFAPSAAVTGNGSIRFVGNIHHQNSQKGYSFIRSKGATEQFGMDVFLHSAQRGSFQLNDQVCFAVLLNKDGKPQAFDLTKPTEADLKRWSNDSAPDTPSGPVEAWVPAGEVWTPKASWNAQEQAAASGAENRYTGTISDFKPGLYGFIKCAELFEQTQQNVWVHHKQIHSFEVGDTVTFTAITNKNGQPQAIDLKSAKGHVVPARRPMQTRYVPAVPKAAGAEHKTASREQPAAKNLPGPIGARKRLQQDLTPVQDSDLVGSRHWGTITAWRPGGMYGFLKCEKIFAAFGKDCWVHHQQIAGFREGDWVSFTLILNKDGNPQAVDLSSTGKRVRQ
ncbi:unnamed protein product [Durusdinium trenchii]|uniref:CSD domain-containing protein n=2 Tax=Durusdinium trenchii TaxID=1381693 RepID=A0ABP0N5X6_9DINO